MYKLVYLLYREVKKSRETQYLIKWKEIGYDQATWELRDDEDNKDIVYLFICL